MLGYVALFAICLWPFTHFFDANIGELFRADPFGFVQPLLFCIAFFAILFVFTVAWRLMQFKRKSLLFNVQLLLIALFFAFQPVYSFSGRVMNSLGFDQGAVVVFILIMLAAIFFLKRYSHREIFNKSVYVGIIVAATMPLLSNVNYIYALFQYDADLEEVRTNFVKQNSSGDTSQPNIYYIIVDGMVGERAYKTITKSDLEVLIEPLVKENWAYLSESRSNYIASASSIGSLFHLNFFRTEETDVSSIKKDDYFPAVTTRSEGSHLYNFLRSQGYSLTFSGSWYSGCRGVWHECIDGEGFQLTRETLLLVDRTPLARLFPTLTHRQVDAITPLMDHVSKHSGRKPTFNFVHHMQPHSPWYYNDLCEPIDVKQYPDRKLYQYSVECLFRTIGKFAKVVETVDPGAIIVVHGDHGWLMNEQGLGVKEIDWPKNILDQRSEILALVKAPRYCIDWLKNDLGPLNIMKFVVACVEQEKPNYVEEKLFIPGHNYAKDERLVNVIQKLHDVKW